VVLHPSHPALRRAWHPVAAASDVRAEPLGVRLLGQDWVIARLGGSLVAFEDRCPHRLAPLSAGRVENGGLRCGYHGWMYDAAGACVEIPALGPGAAIPPRACLTGPADLAERYGVIWLAPDAPLMPIIDIVEAGKPEFVEAYARVTATVGAGLMVDNFLDTAHFPFVHAATIGGAEVTPVEDIVVERDGLGMTVRYEHDFSNLDDPAVAAGTRPLVQRRRLQYTYRAPFSVSLRMDMLDAGNTDVVAMFVQPVDDDSCALHLFILRNGDRTGPEEMDAFVKYELAITDEDLVIQERYRDRSIPIDLTTEVHTKADRMTVELRRILADLVAAAEPGGTA
jgi:vanillate O-demethylase monooxygenase subunit